MRPTTLADRLGTVTTNLVRTVGLEPTWPFGHNVLNVARLPVPPRPHETEQQGAATGALRQDQRVYHFATSDKSDGRTRTYSVPVWITIHHSVARILLSQPGCRLSALAVTRIACLVPSVCRGRFLPAIWLWRLPVETWCSWSDSNRHPEVLRPLALCPSI